MEELAELIVVLTVVKIVGVLAVLLVIAGFLFPSMLSSRISQHEDWRWWEENVGKESVYAGEAPHPASCEAKKQAQGKARSG